jgi:serine/threonine protein kinase
MVPGLSGLSVLAHGGYATVYRAVQDSVAREVAVKVENRTLENEREQRRFLREARAAGSMSSHPHVVDLFDAGVTADQHPYLIMELCDGSYADRMKTAPLAAAEAREVGVKIADALADAHQLGVLHRDVKPANILCSRFGEPALADFGLAVLAEARDSFITLEVLTPAYAPPEMFRQGAPAPAVDVYALCATLYALMHGRPPRWRDDANPSLITLMELFAEPIPDLPGVPSALLDVVRAGMANDPAARPTAGQLRDMLAAVPLGGPVTGTPVSGAPFSHGPWAFGAGAPPWSSQPSASQPAPAPSQPAPSPSQPAASPSQPVPSSQHAASSAEALGSDATVPTRRPRRWRWFFGGLGAVALLALPAPLGVAPRSWSPRPQKPGWADQDLGSVRLVLAEHVLSHEVEDHLPADRRDPAGAHATEQRRDAVLRGHAVATVDLDRGVNREGGRLG